MELYLLRHGIAVERGTAGYDDDAQRPLTPEGRTKTYEVARGLHRLNLKWDALWTSPYVRAVQTAELVAKAYDLPKKDLRETNALLPTATLEELAGQLVEFPNGTRHLLVGHEPHLSSLVGRLIGAGPEYRINFKKAGLLIVETTQLHPEAVGTLLGYLPPRVLRALA